MKKDTPPFRIFAIFGHPLSHTLSPQMQEAGFAAIGLKAFYTVCDIRPSAMTAAFKGVFRFLLDGFNVTVPYKQTVMRFLDEITPEAKTVGAVNTVFRRAAKWIGTNTDVYGFLKSLQTEGRFKPQGRRALVFGAGGAARAVIYGLASQKIRHVAIANRHAGRARNLIRDFKKLFPNTKFEVVSLEKRKLKLAVEHADLIVNATSVGLKVKDLSLIDSSLIPRAGARKKLFFDLIYHIPETAFMKAARRRGHRSVGGLGMLLFQGTRAFEYWTGRKAPVAVMRRALLNGLKSHV